MRFAILLGLPTTLTQRIRASTRAQLAECRGGWSVEYVISHPTKTQIGERDILRTLDLASARDSPHVIGLSTQDGAVRQGIARRIRPHFRFAWLDTKLLSHVPHNIPALISGLNLLLEQEEVWADLVRPSRTDSPLLLPSCTFITSHETLWAKAELFGDSQMIRSAADAVSRFHDDHWRPTDAGPRRWTDDTKLIFDHSGPRHRVAPFPRSWKYSFRIPDGFHYDVTAAHGKGFTLCGIDGYPQTTHKGGHLNIDPHGHILP